MFLEDSYIHQKKKYYNVVKKYYISNSIADVQIKKEYEPDEVQSLEENDINVYSHKNFPQVLGKETMNYRRHVQKQIKKQFLQKLKPNGIVEKMEEKPETKTASFETYSGNSVTNGHKIIKKEYESDEVKPLENIDYNFYWHRDLRIRLNKKDFNYRRHVQKQMKKQFLQKFRLTRIVKKIEEELKSEIDSLYKKKLKLMHQVGFGTSKWNRITKKLNKEVSGLSHYLTKDDIILYMKYLEIEFVKRCSVKMK